MSGFYKIEVPLVLNQSITFSEMNHRNSPTTKKRKMRTSNEEESDSDYRNSAALEIPVTYLLLEQLTACGVYNQSINQLLAKKRTLVFPTIVIGRLTYVSGKKVFMIITAGNDSGSLNNWLGRQQTTENNITLLADIGTVKDDRSGCILIPEKSTNELLRPEESIALCVYLHQPQRPGSSDIARAIADARLEECWTNASSQWKTTVSLTLLVTRSGGAALDFNRKMLTEEKFCDVTLVAKNGTKIKFHRSILATHSPVFANLFNADIKEVNTRMSEETLLVFREYLYLWNFSKAEERPSVRFELLQAGHQYDIKTLTTSMEVILLRKNSYWYTVDVAWRLFTWAKDAKREDLKRKAVKVLKWKIAELVKLPAYLECFEKDKGAVNDLMVGIAEV